MGMTAVQGRRAGARRQIGVGYGRCHPSGCARPLRISDIRSIAELTRQALAEVLDSGSSSVRTPLAPGTKAPPFMAIHGGDGLRKLCCTTPTSGLIPAVRCGLRRATSGRSRRPAAPYFPALRISRCRASIRWTRWSKYRNGGTCGHARSLHPGSSASPHVRSVSIRVRSAQIPEPPATISATRA
jgi:hypothetical protein